VQAIGDVVEEKVRGGGGSFTFLLTFTMAVATAPGSDNLGLDLCDILLKPTSILHALVAAKKGRAALEWSVLAQRVMSNASLFDDTEPAHSKFTRACLRLTHC
jgi:hypothetical protein